MSIRAGARHAWSAAFRLLMAARCTSLSTFTDIQRSTFETRHRIGLRLRYNDS